METVSNGENLHKISNPVFWGKYEKNHKFVVCWITTEVEKVSHHLWQLFHIYPKYSDILTSYHICPKIWTCPFNTHWCVLNICYMSTNSVDADQMSSDLGLHCLLTVRIFRVGQSIIILFFWSLINYELFESPSLPPVILNFLELNKKKKTFDLCHFGDNSSDDKLMFAFLFFPENGFDISCKLGKNILKTHLLNILPSMVSVKYFDNSEFHETFIY